MNFRNYHLSKVLINIIDPGLLNIVKFNLTKTDRTMILQSFRPPADLLPFISRYLYGYTNFSGTFCSQSIPRGFPALMVIMTDSDEEMIEVIQPRMAQALTNGVFLFGQGTQIWWSNISIKQAFMVVLNPKSLPIILKDSASTITDRVIRVDEIWPGCRFLPEQLRDQKSQFARLNILDTFLRQLFREKTPKTDEVEGAINRIFNLSGQVRVNELAAYERISIRSLTRKFNEKVGMSPKQYARVIRFRALMNYILRHPEICWLDITYQFGYYDQAHFIKDFQQMTGNSPSQYLGLDQSFDGLFIKILSAY